MLVEINRLNFENYQIKLNLTGMKSGGVNLGIEPVHRETSDLGRDRNVSRIGQKFIFP